MMCGRTSTRSAPPPTHAQQDHAGETSETAACHRAQDGKNHSNLDLHVQQHDRAHQLSLPQQAIRDGQRLPQTSVWAAARSAAIDLDVVISDMRACRPLAERWIFCVC
jgi:hypothetical protein